MQPSSPQFPGAEIWRGGVAPWQCDEMGHMNVRFYIGIATEGLVGLAAELGLPHAFTAGATSTLLPREHHVRFLKEAHVGSGLVMTGGVLEMGETDATLLQLLFHHTGEPAAAFTVKVSHVTPGELRPFAWNSVTRARAEALRLQAPEFTAPRGLASGPVDTQASQARAAALGLPTTARGALGVTDCDVFGRMVPEQMMARIYSAIGHVFGRTHAAVVKAQPDLDGRLGGAAVEYRAAYHAWPRIGERVELRAGLKALTPKSRTVTHWLLDPATGRPWATSEMVSLFLDLKARKALALSDAALAAMDASPDPTLSL